MQPPVKLTCRKCTPAGMCAAAVTRAMCASELGQPAPCLRRAHRQQQQNPAPAEAAGAGCVSLTLPPANTSLALLGRPTHRSLSCCHCCCCLCCCHDPCSRVCCSCLFGLRLVVRVSGCVRMTCRVQSSGRLMLPLQGWTLCSGV